MGTGSALVLRTPQNIERYRDLLTTKLTEVELRYIDTEERFAIAILHAIHEPNRPLMDADAIVFDSVLARVIQNHPNRTGPDLG